MQLLHLAVTDLDECIGLYSSFENAWVDCFREADLSLLTAPFSMIPRLRESFRR